MSGRTSAPSVPYIFTKRPSVMNSMKRYSAIRSQSVDTETTLSILSHRRTAFMDNRIKTLQIQIKEIENSLEEAIEKLPLGKFE